MINYKLQKIKLVALKPTVFKSTSWTEAEFKKRERLIAEAEILGKLSH